MHPSNAATFAAVLFALLLLLDWYAFQGIRRLLEDLDSGSLIASIIPWVYWTISIGIPVILVTLMFNMGARPELRFTLSIFGSIYITLLVTKFVFAVPLLMEDTLRVAAGSFNWLRDSGSSGQFMPERRKFVSQMAIGLAAIPFTSFLYGIFKGKYDYRIHRHTLYFPDLPDAFDGFTITQISDVHSGSFDNTAAVQRGIDLIKAQKSDLFVFTGDLVNTMSSEFIPYREMFSQIKAPFGQFSILGNHDYGDYGTWPSAEAKQKNFNELLEHHDTVGYRLLRNENVRIQKDGQSISLIGIENWGKGFGQYGDLEKALQGINSTDFKLLLSHDPSHWEEQVKNHEQFIHLTLSGHTHGMQMGVEIPGFKWSPIKYRYPRWAGVYEEAGRRLNVNRGFGFLGFSGRVGILPEITVLELRKEKLT